MKRRWWQSYVNPTRAERNGVSALLILAAVLSGIRLSMPYFVKPAAETAQERALQIAMGRLVSAGDGGYTTQGFNDLKTDLFPFDPNSLDSTGFLRLGLQPKTTHILLNWRRSGKIFYRKEQLRELWTLKREEYNRLCPYIRIKSLKKDEDYGAENTAAYKIYPKEPLPPIIDLNTTDANTLIRLNGIGPTLAGRIIDRRKALGGYVRIEQLREVYPFADTTFAMLRDKLRIQKDAVRKIRLNDATEEELASHPYIGEKMARNIILYRNGLQGFQNIQQLRQVPLMNEENYRKIAAYFSIQ